MTETGVAARFASAKHVLPFDGRDFATLSATESMRASAASADELRTTISTEATAALLMLEFPMQTSQTQMEMLSSVTPLASTLALSMRTGECETTSMCSSGPSASASVPDELPPGVVLKSSWMDVKRAPELAPAIEYDCVFLKRVDIVHEERLRGLMIGAGIRDPKAAGATYRAAR